MEIRKETIPLDARFPFSAVEAVMPQGYDMDGRMHWHDCLEISMVRSGRGRYQLEGREIPMAPGDVIVLNNTEPHRLVVDEGPMEQPVFIFDPSFVWCSGVASDGQDYLRPFFSRGSDFLNRIPPDAEGSGEIRMHLEAISREMSERRDGYRAMVRARLLMVLTYLYRHFRASGTVAESAGARRKRLSVAEEALRRIESGYAEPLALVGVAAEVHVSPQYLSSVFRRTHGVGFLEALHRVRVDHAVRLLEETDRKVTDIASACGFGSLAAFHRSFLRLAGRTPSACRAARRGPED
jgi:AraC-like DNA-binding protein